MKSMIIFALFSFFATPVFSQSLPDEINYGPYESRHRTLVREKEIAQEQLNKSQASLRESQNFIKEALEHIAKLKVSISRSQSEIVQRQRGIETLQSQISNNRNEDSQVVSTLRVKQSEEARLISRYDQARSDLRPLQESVRLKEQRLRGMVSNFEQLQRYEREASQNISRLEKKAENIDRQHLELKNKIRQSEGELQSIGARISSLESQISNAQAALVTMRSNLSTESAKLGALSNRVVEFENELARLRASGAKPEEITAAERRLSAARNSRDNTAKEISSLQSQISQKENEISSIRTQIASLRQSQNDLPGQISSAQSRMRQLEQERRQVQEELNRYLAEIHVHRRNLDIAKQQIDSLRGDLRNDELLVLRQEQLLENLSRQLQSTRAEVVSLSERSRVLNQQIIRNLEEIRTHEAMIPRLRAQIQNEGQEILEAERDLVIAREDEITFTAAVIRDEAQLSNITNKTEAARLEMATRYSLYNKYLVEATELGSEQSNAGNALGEKEGQRMSDSQSKANGRSIGLTLGRAESKHWSSVRGEIEGYLAGHLEGLNSTEDIQRATSDATSKAMRDAEVFAQLNFKPVFFEEFVQEQFKRQLPGVAKSLFSEKQIKHKKNSLEFEQALETIPPLTLTEISKSNEIKTPLDSVISELEKNIKEINETVVLLARPEVVYKEPTSIPYGVASCNQVYKGVAAFKAACENSYRQGFFKAYVGSAKLSFEKEYRSLFEQEFNNMNIQTRETNYLADYSVARKVSHAEGLKVGKIEIYESTYVTAYKQAYDTELVQSRQRAKTQALIELQSFLKMNPLLTLSQTQLVSESFRGGDEVRILGAVKNVGDVPLSGAAIFRLTEVINGEQIKNEAILNNAAALAVTQLPELKVKILQNAKGGEKIIIRGVIDLPGDRYRPSRQEKFELTQVLNVNPEHELNLEYNKKPSIKGVFRRNVHFLTLNITPKYDDISEGYKLSLTPVGETSNHIEMRDSLAETGKISKGSSKEMKLSYVFKDTAKGKTCQLELSVTFAGKVIKKELISLMPN